MSIDTSWMIADQACWVAVNLDKTQWLKTKHDFVNSKEQWVSKEDPYGVYYQGCIKGSVSGT